MKRFSYYDTKLGLLAIGCDDGVVTDLRWVERAAGPSEPSRLSDMAADQVREYLDGARRRFELPLAPGGTDFQRRVWRALADTPYGATTSYGALAAAIGRPRAARAVGAAVGRNPIWLAIPCHRCIGSDGSLTGYAGGLARKAALLALEAENRK